MTRSPEFKKSMNRHHARVDKKEARRQKKLGRIGWRAGGALGLGIGVLLARLIAPLIFDEVAQDVHFAFKTAGWSLFFYGVILLASLIFARKHIFKINLVLSYIVMPALVMMIIIQFTA